MKMLCLNKFNQQKKIDHEEIPENEKGFVTADGAQKYLRS